MIFNVSHRIKVCQPSLCKLVTQPLLVVFMLFKVWVTVSVLISVTMILVIVCISIIQMELETDMLKNNTLECQNWNSLYEAMSIWW